MEDQRLLFKIRESYLSSGGVYGSPRIHCDLAEDGERIGEERVAQIMKAATLKALRGYKKPRYKSGVPAAMAPNRLGQRFDVSGPDRAWVTGVTYIRTYEGWLYLAVVLDLFSQLVVGWSMKATLARYMALDALLMAVWRRRPRREVNVHSDQGSQFGSDEWRRFCDEHNLVPSMSRRGNCYDNAVAEAFLSSLKKERIRRRIYPTREEARSDVFDYVEIFYNRTRCHSYLGNVSP